MREIGFHGENTEVKVKFIIHCGVSFRIITFFHNLPHFFRDNILNDNRHQPYCALTSPFCQVLFSEFNQGKKSKRKTSLNVKGLAITCNSDIQTFLLDTCYTHRCFVFISNKTPFTVKNTFCINFDNLTSGVWLKISI